MKVCKYKDNYGIGMIVNLVIKQKEQMRTILKDVKANPLQVTPRLDQEFMNGNYLILVVFMPV